MARMRISKITARDSQENLRDTAVSASDVGGDTAVGMSVGSFSSAVINLQQKAIRYTDYLYTGFLIKAHWIYNCGDVSFIAEMMEQMQRSD